MVSRPHLKKWLQLEQIKNEKADRIKVIYRYLSAFLELSEQDLDALPWYDTVSIYIECLKVNKIELKLPFIEHPDNPKKDEPWDYPERLWYSFLHLLADAYHWTVEYISELDVDDALALVQEVLTDRQLDREWQYSLAEIAYPYNESSKKSEFKPLPRPRWMAPEYKIKKIRIPLSALPVGNVIGVSKEFEAAVLAEIK